ncbi:MAG: hypothetical protein AB2L20_06290 [Mangrovibacterium sp.]
MRLLQDQVPGTWGIPVTGHIHTKREQSISLGEKALYLPVLEGLTAYEVLRVLTGVVSAFLSRITPLP